MHLAGLCIWGTTRINNLFLIPILLFITKWNNWVFFYVGWRYYTINITIFFHFFSIVFSSVRIFLCFSITKILLTLVIIRRLIIQCIVLSTINIGWNRRFTLMLIMLWLPFTEAMLLMLYKKLTIKKVMIKILRKKLNALNMFQLAYYWPDYENYICW